MKTTTQLETLRALKSHFDKTVEKWLAVAEENLNDDDFRIEISINNKSFKLEANADLYVLFDIFLVDSVQDEFEHISELVIKKKKSWYWNGLSIEDQQR